MNVTIISNNAILKRSARIIISALLSGILTILTFTSTYAQCSFSVGTTITSETCYGDCDGTAIVTAYGGVSPYFYLWSNGETSNQQTGMCPGIYELVITDSDGCIDTIEVCITSPGPLVVPISYTHVSCPGSSNGSASVSAFGGTMPYTYLWSNGATSASVSNLAAGNYSVIVKDAKGCSVNNTVIIHNAANICSRASGQTQLFYDDWSDASGNWIYDTGWRVGNGCTPDCGNAPNSFFPFRTYTTDYSGSMTSQVFDGCGYTDIYAGYCIRHDIGGPDYQDIQAIYFEMSSDGGNTWNTLKSYYTFENNWELVENSILLPGAAGTNFQVRFRAKGPGGIFFMGGWGIDNFKIYGNSPGYTPVDSIQVTSVVNNPSCASNSNNGSINVTVSGGVPPYNYRWSNNATTEDLDNLSAGVYTLIISDSLSCKYTVTFNLTAPPVITTSVVVSNYNGYGISCNGDTDGYINLTTSGGILPYTYTWSNGATTEDISNLEAGTYVVTIKDSIGCFVSDTIKISKPLELDVSIYAYNVSCNGGSDGRINLLVTGGVSPYNYSWTNGSTTQSISNLNAGSYGYTVTDNNGCSLGKTINIREPDSLIIYPTVTDVSCNGYNNGSVNLVVNGGTPPYVYNWSNGDTIQNISNLSAGDYIVTVTDDNACAASLTIVVSEREAIIVSAEVINVSCNGGADGSISLTANGGVAPYTYQWSNGATTQDISGLRTGTYMLTVTDSVSCFISDTITITEPEEFTVAANTYSVSCNGSNDGSIILLVNGGTPPYSYSWTNGYTTQHVTSLSAGSYVVTITDNNGCATTENINIAEPDSLVISAVITDASCSGSDNGSINLVVNGGTNPYIYTWSNGATTQNIFNLNAGNYMVTVIDNNACSTSLNLLVNERDTISVSVTVINVSCNDNGNGSVSIIANNGTGPFFYSWSNGATTAAVSNLSPGNYSVTISNEFGCSLTEEVTITEPVPVSLSLMSPAYMNGRNISIYNGDDGSIDATVTGGTIPYMYTWNTGATTEDINGLQAGVYTLTVTDNNFCMSIASIELTGPDILAMPNGFSPNHDGANDSFIIRGLEGYPENVFVVYNRWGNTVFSERNYKNDWRGHNMQGSELPEGTYFVILEINDGAITLNGYVDMRR